MTGIFGFSARGKAKRSLPSSVSILLLLLAKSLLRLPSALKHKHDQHMNHMSITSIEFNPQIVIKI